MIKYLLLDNDVFKKIDEPWKAYFLGWAYSDGNMNKRRDFNLTLAEKDKSVLDFFNQKIYGGKRNPRYKKPQSVTSKTTGKTYLCKPQYQLFVGQRTVCDDLIRLGVVPAKSLILTFPSEDILPKPFVSYFIRGYFEGDGSINIEKIHYLPRIEILGTESFTKILSSILLYEYEINCRINRRNKIFSLVITRCKDVCLFSKHIYPEGDAMCLQRKRDKMKMFCETKIIK